MENRHFKRLDVNVNVNYVCAMSSNTTPMSPKDPVQWGIQALAERFDVTQRAIRFYEDKGLLSPKREGGVRIFDRNDAARLEHILRAKRLGFTLDDIKSVMDVTDGVVRDRAELVQRKTNFQKAIASLKRRRKDIEILVKDMSQLCSDIDDHLQSDADDTGVFFMANAYQAQFDSHFQDDDFEHKFKKTGS